MLPVQVQFQAQLSIFSATGTRQQKRNLELSFESRSSLQKNFETVNTVFCMYLQGNSILLKIMKFNKMMQ